MGVAVLLFRVQRYYSGRVAGTRAMVPYAVCLASTRYRYCERGSTLDRHKGLCYIHPTKGGVNPKREFLKRS